MVCVKGPGPVVLALGPEQPSLHHVTASDTPLPPATIRLDVVSPPQKCDAPLHMCVCAAGIC